jgi:uncharacterized protein YbaP (TraB family)
LLLTACGPRTIEARPPLWHVRDGDTEIWLLGTIHALPPGVRWATPAVSRAIDGADLLVTEIPAADPQKAAAMFEEFAAVPGLPPLAARLPRTMGGALEKAVAASGVPAATLDGMRSWAAAVTIGAGPVRSAGASPDFGVEAALAQRFAGRRRAAFETQAWQLGQFAALPETAQRVMLARAVQDSGGYATTLAAWTRGDAAGLAASVDPGFHGAPIVRAVLLTRRNARWSGWIARRMAAPGRVLVAVGAGHLVGRDSVVAMLRARGLKVERVQ